jgi:uncharacterized RDD family membrane protein YckC
MVSESVTMTETRYAGFWLRLVALIVDLFILGCIGFVLTLLLGGGMSVDPADPQAAPGLGAANGISFVINIAYFTLLEGGSRQATLGKSLLGLKVTDVDGNPIGYGKALLRNIAKIVSGLILGIGYIMAAFTARKQALHDRIASCLVVKR